MERIAFLLPPGDQHLFCMLNPESVVVNRCSGLVCRPGLNAAASVHDQSSSSLAYDGSQMTFIDLKLLFDVSLPDLYTSSSEDVRDLTSALFRLAGPVDSGGGTILRILWGKSWNIPCAIVEIAERLDYFNDSGEPRRSWLSLRVLVVEDDDYRPVEWTKPDTVAALLHPETMNLLLERDFTSAVDMSEETVLFNERLDNIAARVYGSPRLWRILAEYNALDSILPQPGKDFLKVPPMESLMGMIDHG